MDPKWEFNANQYVDFNNIQDQDTSNADEFFDFNMETGERVEEVDDLAEEGAKVERIKEEDREERKETTEKPQPSTTSESADLGTPYVMVNPASGASEEDPKKRRPANLVTTWGARGGGAARKSNPIVVPQGRGGAARKSSPRVAPQLPPKSSYVKQSQASLSVSQASRPMTPRRAALKAKVEAAVASARNSPRLAKITPKRLGTNTRAQLSGARTPELAKYQGKTTAAMARTPEVMKRYKAKLSQGQNAIRSMMDTESFRAKLAARKEVSADKKIKQISAVKPEITKPVEFNFTTSTRIRSNSASKTSETPDFTRSLRSYSRQSTEGSGVTQPVPFKLSGRKRRSQSVDLANKFQSQAEMVEKFHSGTPDRFRSKPGPRPRSVSPGRQQRVTVPHTPQLMTRGRSRPQQVLSQQEMEEQELTRIRANKFTARPAPKAGTGAVGLPARVQLPVVEPQSPAFALRSRMAEKRVRVEPEPEPEPVVKARPAPHRGVPVLLPPLPRKATLPTPFSFESRDKVLMEKKEEKIKQILEEEKKAREFHAKPIMKEEAIRMPPKQAPAPTKVEPFKLAIEERVEERLTKWQASVQKELEDQRKAALFKATDPKVLNKAPFEPKPSEKPLSEVSNFSLHTDRRAEERTRFEIKLKQKEAEIEGAKRELEMRKKREEEEEIQRLRREQVHRANPIRNYKQLDITKSDKPLTTPASPNWVAKGKANNTYNQK